MLHGKRIILQPLLDSDLDLMDQMNQDSEMMSFLGGIGTARSRVKEFIQKQQACFEQQGWGWMIIETQ